MKNKPKYYDEIQKLRLIDDELMELCFDNNIEAAELLVHIILSRDDINIISAKTQVALKGLMREVRLDILAVDDKGRKYNIEFQRKRKGAEPERARLNASMIDVNSLDKGEDFTELPEVYVIFITEHDILGGGLPIYTIDWKINETGEIFGCRSHIVYVNGAHRDAGTALGKLVHDIFCVRPEDMYYYPLAGKVRYFKEDEEGVRKMSEVMEKIFASERKKYEAAIKEQQKGIAQKLIEIGKLALSEIAETTGLSVSTVRRMAKKLEAAQTAQA